MNKISWFAVASLFLGIFTLIPGILIMPGGIPPYSWLISLLAIISGIIGIVQSVKNKKKGLGMAIAGIIMSLGLMLGIIFMGIAFIVIGNFGKTMHIMTSKFGLYNILMPSFYIFGLSLWALMLYFIKKSQKTRTKTLLIIAFIVAAGLLTAISIISGSIFLSLFLLILGGLITFKYSR